MGDNTSPLRRYTGLQELFHQRQLEVKIWIEEVVGERLVFGDNLGSGLRDGTMLCRLINAIYPGLIDKWYETEPMPKHRMIENINIFLQKCRAVGVPEDKLFNAMDLFENRNLPLVVDCLLTLQLVTEAHRTAQQSSQSHSPPPQVGFFGHSSTPPPASTSASSTAYFSPPSHALPPPISALPRQPSASHHAHSAISMAGFVREAVRDVRAHMLVPLFIGMSGGFGICAGRLLYLKLAGIFGRMFAKSLTQTILDYIKLKTT
eukprot:Phypoly_transcript_15300.p1 GENE.Phypoly_transcript_15300~~Phypoly_transcript_15300.p1  ORF type:complete len:262 (+),score=57.78 Phypoly_transcript_15300:109-894(+)